MFSKILIANRGEIACRVIKTARKMGLKTVAVYSEADQDALHVKMADEKVFIGNSPAAESYLIADKIIDAALKTGAQAIHPGYGFLSENAAFCERLKTENITFIGPAIKAIAAMGDKIESKKIAEKAGVNVIPGYTAEIIDADEAVKIANDIGYPVMIKASAGGGGKGMRVAYNAEEAFEGFNSARHEAISSFGDDRIFLEKFIENPRHIEIQILGDSHGNIIYLAERDCSVQRRHQKVIEEAPSSLLDDKTRKAMGEQAVLLSKVVNYESAGTVEFIVDKDLNFYFLEMNTRLQVEHPVTEYITGIDLVEQMILIAAGEKLTLAQEDVKITGWAMEARIYAEDPIKGFLPAIGRVKNYIQPEENDNIRIDTGIYEGAEISMFYDPMIAKLITYGKDRDEAISHMLGALDDYYIEGVGHNMNFLSDVIKSDRFKNGEVTTNFIAEEYPEGFMGASCDTESRDIMIAAAVTAHACHVGQQTTISGQMSSYAVNFGNKWITTIKGEDTEAHFFVTDKGCAVTFDEKNIEIETNWVPGKALFSAIINGQKITVKIKKTTSGFILTHHGTELEIKVSNMRTAELRKLMPEKIAPDMSNYLICPMPGLLVSMDVSAGDHVKAGQVLCIIEAMKMENILKAEKDLTIKSVNAASGDSLSVDEIIIEFEE
jgi:propionyl-CoA carboxylase alpha chain